MIAHLIWIFSNLPSDASALQSSISALERELATLDSRSGSWDWCLAGFTLLVAVGVGMEIIVVIKDHTAEMEEWHLCELIPKKPSLVKLGLEITSIILVTIGILGELGTGLWISHINSQLRVKSEELRSKSDQLLALVTKEAGDAKASADSAAEAASSATKDAEVAHQMLAGVIAALEPHILGEKEEREITEDCKKVGRPDIHIHVFASMGAYGFQNAIAIERALTKAGFTVETTESLTSWSDVYFGSPLNEWTVFEIISNSILKRGHFSSNGLAAHLPTGEPIRVYVGERRIGPLPKIKKKAKTK